MVSGVNIQNMLQCAKNASGKVVSIVIHVRYNLKRMTTNICFRIHLFKYYNLTQSKIQF